MRCLNMSSRERSSELSGHGTHEDKFRWYPNCSLTFQRYYSGMEQTCPAGCKWILTEYISDRSDFEPCWHRRSFKVSQLGSRSWPQSLHEIKDPVSAEVGLFEGSGGDEAQLLSLVRCDPGETRTWLARVIGWTDSRTNLTLDRLKRLKKVRIRRVGNAVCVYPDVCSPEV